MRRMIPVLVISALLGGCMNMPTDPAQIVGSYTSGLKYDNYDCTTLAAELNSLNRRESQLIIAQEQRRSSSRVQAFWIGVGQGDGVEASELAMVRGEKEAVMTAMEVKMCGPVAPTNSVSDVLTTPANE